MIKSFGPFSNQFLNKFGSLSKRVWVVFGPIRIVFGSFSDRFAWFLRRFFIFFGVLDVVIVVFVVIAVMVVGGDPPSAARRRKKDLPSRPHLSPPRYKLDLSTGNRQIPL